MTFIVVHFAGKLRNQRGQTECGFTGIFNLVVVGMLTSLTIESVAWDNHEYLSCETALTPLLDIPVAFSFTQLK